MKSIPKIVFIFLLLSSTLSFGQANFGDRIGKLFISDGHKNGIDITPDLLEGGAYTAFYTVRNNDSSIFMANFWATAGTQSYGRLNPTETASLDVSCEGFENYKTDIFYFNWDFTNSYDTNKGIAAVQIIKVYKPEGDAFVIKIVPENYDLIVYKGYMGGGIDFSMYK